MFKYCLHVKNNYYTGMYNLMQIQSLAFIIFIVPLVK